MSSPVNNTSPWLRPSTSPSFSPTFCTSLSPCPEVEAQQWDQLGRFRKGEVSSPALETKCLAEAIEKIEVENMMLATEKKQLERANENQLAQIRSLKMRVAELEGRIASMQALPETK